MPLQITRAEPGDGKNKLSCSLCGGSEVSTKICHHTFVYGEGAGAVELAVDLPVRSCRACEFEYLDEASERLKHETVCNHLGVLSPHKIRSIRRNLGMSRKEFAQVTGLGTASLNRWENGLSIQTYGYDRYLRLLALPEIVPRLEMLLMSSQIADSGAYTDTSKWKVLTTNDEDRLRKQSNVYQLRPAA